MEVFDVEEANHVAMALLPAWNGHGYVCGVTYDPVSSLLLLSARIGQIQSPTVEQLASLMLLQSRARLARLDYDPEDHFLRIHAASIWPKRVGPSRATRLLIGDVRRILSDDRLSPVL